MAATSTQAPHLFMENPLLERAGHFDNDPVVFLFSSPLHSLTLDSLSLYHQTPLSGLIIDNKHMKTGMHLYFICPECIGD